MIISCPECTTRYVVSPAAIGEDGRRVQCSRCRAVWFEAPAPEGAEVAPERAFIPRDNLQKATNAGQENAGEAAVPAAEAAASAGADKQEEDPLGIFGDDFRSNVPAVVESRSRGIVIGWMLLAVFVIGLLGSAYFFRDGIEDRSDAAATLYQKWDVLVLRKKPKPPAPLEPTTIVQPHASSYLVVRQSPQIRFEGDAASLVVTIEVRNSAPFDITLPPLRGVIRNAEGVEIFSWVQPLETPVIAANGVLQFQAGVDKIPAESAEAELAFDWR